MKRIKKGLTLFLAFVMLLGVFPIQVLAEKTEIVIDCNRCGKDWGCFCWDEDEGLDWLLSNRFCEDCGACVECMEDWHCSECGQCMGWDDTYCLDCHRCWTCIAGDNYENHCRNCLTHSEDICTECDLGLCRICHEEEYGYCTECGACMYHIYEAGEMCAMFDATPQYLHCMDHCILCVDCGECFLSDLGDYCESCERCVDCIPEAGTHCAVCGECFGGGRVTVCDGGSEDYGDVICHDCCVEMDFHCPICGNHVHPDEWCESGGEGTHCKTCFNEDCPGCGLCLDCFGLDLCSTCGLCEECCREASEEAGCVCGMCVSDSDFEDGEHKCAACTQNYSCEIDFCSDCSLCIDCCTELSEDSGCECGLCVESTEYDEHLCEVCGVPSCANGGQCESCGLCMECCIEQSETAGCQCGVCVESDEFSDHEICSECGKLSCAVSICGICGKCADCCDCAKPELTEAEPAAAVIRYQPTDARGSLIVNEARRSANPLIFRAGLYLGTGCTYQWYQIKDGGTPEALNDQIYDNPPLHYEFIVGAKKDTLRIAMPKDACCHTYEYYCDIFDEDGTYLVSTRKSVFRASHTYELKEVPGTDTHILHCIGKNCTETIGKAYMHRAGHERLDRCASETLGAMYSIRCVDCGATLSFRETEPLTNHVAHQYEYQPITTVNDHKIVCLYHRLECICGEQTGGMEPHEWGEWELVTPATEKNVGEKRRYCRLCGWFESAEIPVQTHHHEFSYYDWGGEDTSLWGADKRYHWMYCMADDCDAIAGKAAHEWSEWSVTACPGENHDGLAERYCTVCGYEQGITLREGGYAVLARNTSQPVRTVRAWNTWTLIASAPVGYRFDHWENLNPEHFPIAELETHPTDEKITIKIPRDTDPYYEEVRYDESGAAHPVIREFPNSVVVEAVCERLDNSITLVNAGRDGDVTLYPGQKISGLNGDIIMADDGTDPAYTEWYDSQPYTAFYKSQTEDGMTGERTAVLELRGYDAGPVTLNTTGLRCNLIVELTWDNEICGSGQNTYAIRGCKDGGDVTVTSQTGGRLTVCLDENGGMCRIIEARRPYKWIPSELYVSGDAKLYLGASLYGSGGTLCGLYAPEYITVSDDAYIDVNFDCFRATPGSAVAMEGIRASKEVNIDTTDGVLFELNNTGSDDIRVIPIHAQKTFVQSGSLEAFVTGERTKLCSGELYYDAEAFVPHTALMKSLSTARGFDVADVGLFEGYRFGVDEASFGSGSVVVENLYFKDSDGKWLIPISEYDDAEDIRVNFKVTMPIGSFRPVVYAARTGGIYERLEPYAYDNHGTYSYSVHMDADIDIRLAEYALLKTPTFGGSTEMTLLSGQAGIFEVAYDGRSASELTESGKRPGSGTESMVLFERYDENHGWVIAGEHSPFDFLYYYKEDSAYSVPGTSTRYRQTVVYEGRPFCGPEITVNWTDDREAVSKNTCDYVELYLDHVPTVSSEDGGGWINLDAASPYLVYVPASDSFTRASRRDESTQVLVASFTASDGTLTLNGDRISSALGDFDLTSRIRAIRTEDDYSFGDLKIVLRGNTTVGNDYDSYGFVDEYGTGSFNHDAEDAIITNRSGSVEITSANGSRLTLENTASARRGVAPILGVYASGDILLSEKVRLDHIANTYGTAAGAESERISLKAGGNVYLTQQASVTVYHPETNAKGGAMAVQAGRDFLMSGSSSLSAMLTGTYSLNTSMAAVGAVNVGVFGDASLTLTCGGDIYNAVKADEEVVFNTAGSVYLLSGSARYGCGETVSAGGLRIEQANPVRLLYTASTNSYDQSVHGAASSCEAQYDTDTVALYSTDKIDTGDYCEQLYRSGSTQRITVSAPEGGCIGGHLAVIESPDIEGVTQTVTDGITLRTGDTVTLTAADAANGYTFTGWKYSGIEKPDVSGNTIRFTVPSNAVRLEARYAVAYSFSLPFQTGSGAYDPQDEGLMCMRFEAPLDASDVQGVTVQYFNDSYGEWQSLTDAFVPAYVHDFERNVVTYSLSAFTHSEGGSYWWQSKWFDFTDGMLYRYAYKVSGSAHGEYTYSEPFTLSGYWDDPPLLATDDNGVIRPITVPDGKMGETVKINLSENVDVRRFDVGVYVDESLKGAVKAKIQGSSLLVTFLSEHDAVTAESGLIGLDVGVRENGYVFRIPVSVGKIEWESSYGIYVDGVPVTDANAGNVLGDGKVSYDEGILTLKDAHIGTATYSATETRSYIRDSGLYLAAGILSGGGLTLRIEGNCVIDLGSDAPVVFDGGEVYTGDVIYTGLVSCYGPISVTGSGTLTVTAERGAESSGSFEMNGGKVVMNVSNLALETTGDVTVNAGTLVLGGGINVRFMTEKDDIVLGGGRLEVIDPNIMNAHSLKLGGGSFLFRSDHPGTLDMLPVDCCGIRYHAFIAPFADGTDGVQADDPDSFLSCGYVNAEPDRSIEITQCHMADDTIYCSLTSGAPCKVTMVGAEYTDGRFTEASMQTVYLKGVSEQSFRLLFNNEAETGAVYTIYVLDENGNPLCEPFRV